MAKLTKAQNVFLKNIDKWRGSIYFKRNVHTGKETCYIGNHKVSKKVFFFFYDIGYLLLADKLEGRLYEYFYMSCLKYKLDEYLEDFKQPYCVPE